MSFSSEVKEELSRQLPAARHCRIAEIAAFLAFCGQVLPGESGGFQIRLQTENVFVARKYFTLLRKTFNIEAELFVKQNQKEQTCTVLLDEPEEVQRVLMAVKREPSDPGDPKIVHTVVIQRQCCKRAFLRGAFLAAGSISDPNRFYHFEIVCSGMEQAEEMLSIIGSFGVEARIIERKKHFVVYVKEGDQIVELLGLMEAGISLMNLENIRIMRGMRGTVNRKVNCETANLNKTARAAVRQLEDIRYVRDHMGFSALPEGLSEIAELRLQYPEASLAELGAMLTPAVGKSGVNHRLRKLKGIAEELKEIGSRNLEPADQIHRSDEP